ncbi:MAG: glycosyltransferase family 4 protein [Deltaproteobacteria bacterium]|nr:glycosyltransferase family 4 protein [Deltaproteobacteria bacterium]
MRALMFGWEFPPQMSGGLGTVCKALTSHLSGQGIDILFVMPCVNGNRPVSPHFRLIGANEIALSNSVVHLYERLSPETLKLLRIDSLLQPYDTLESYSLHVRTLARRIQEYQAAQQGRGERLALHGGYGRDLLEEVRRYAIIGSVLGLQETFDIIHAHDWITFPAAIEAKRVSGRPMICHVHATEFDRTGEHPNQEIYDIERYGLEQADRIIAVSHRTREMLIARYGLPPDKIAVIHNAVSKEKQLERDQIKKGFSEQLVLFLGRVTLQKGPDYFVEAARLVLQALPHVRFVMAGTGDMLPRLIERVAAYRLQKAFHFTGFLQGREVEQIYAMSDLYVMPSVSEPFGVTPFEAMLYHVPTIVSKQSGIAEVLQSAIKVDFWDIQMLAAKIIQVLSDSTFSRELVRRGAAELEQVSWDSAAGHCRRLYEELCRP